MSVLVPVWLLAAPGGAWAAPGQHGGGGSGGHASGGHASGGGGARSGGGASQGRAGGGSAVPRGTSGGATASGTTSGASGSGSQVDSGATGPHAASGAGQPTTGKAVPRGTVPPAGGGGTVVVPGYGYGFYPWGFGGLGFVGGYYGGFYDPWYDPGAYYPTSGSDPSSDQGAIRLKVKPRGAQVYVDGYYAGNVDDFNGVFERLHLATGPHHIEFRAPGYEPLEVDVQIERDHTITYEGELKPLR